MLVLTRKSGEAIVFPSLDITITVASIHGNRVKLGIVAPPETVVPRLELWGRLRPQGAVDECRAAVGVESCGPRHIPTVA
jgi:carbon storage regulator CsrA